MWELCPDAWGHLSSVLGPWALVHRSTNFACVLSLPLLQFPSFLTFSLPSTVHLPPQNQSKGTMGVEPFIKIPP